MTEQNFEEFLKKSAQGYNAPPVRVPREEMWSAIQAKRSSGPQVVYGGGATYLIRHRFGTKAWLGAAAAAMLLVATGVGIGRWSATRATRQNVASALPQQPVVVNQPANEGVGSSQPGEASIPLAGSTPQDRALIEKTLQQDHVMTRLRTAIPAGAQRGS